MKEPTPPPAGPIVLSVNAVIDGRFFRAGKPVPYADETAVPDPLKPFITAPEPDDGPQGAPGIRFQQGIIYRTDAQGHIITKTGARQAAQLAGADAWQAQAEEEAIAAQALPDGAAEALQAEHDINVALQIKAAEIAQARRDDLEEAARAEALRAQEPAKPAEFHVKRGSVYRRTGDVRLRPGEQVFTRQPNGQWWTAGIVDSSGGLPPEETIL